MSRQLTICSCNRACSAVYVALLGFSCSKRSQSNRAALKSLVACSVRDRRRRTPSWLGSNCRTPLHASAAWTTDNRHVSCDISPSAAHLHQLGDLSELPRNSLDHKVKLEYNIFVYICPATWPSCAYCEQPDTGSCDKSFKVHPPEWCKWNTLCHLVSINNKIN